MGERRRCTGVVLSAVGWLTWVGFTWTPGVASAEPAATARVEAATEQEMTR